jgi:hypothetical protein
MRGVSVATIERQTTLGERPSTKTQAVLRDELDSVSNERIYFLVRREMSGRGRGGENFYGEACLFAKTPSAKALAAADARLKEDIRGSVLRCRIGAFGPMAKFGPPQKWSADWRGSEVTQRRLSWRC